MSSDGILPAMNGSAFELGKCDIEEGEVLSGEIPVILTDEKINYLLGRFQKIFGDEVTKEGSNIMFDQYGSFLVACPCQSSTRSQGIVTDKRIPVAQSLNATRARNSALPLDGLKNNGSKELLRDKPVPVAPSVDISRGRNNLRASDGFRNEKNGPKDLLKGEPAQVNPSVNFSSERNVSHISDGSKQKEHGPKNLLKSKPVSAAPAVKVSRERNSKCTSDGIKERKNGPKGLVRDISAPAAQAVNVSKETKSGLSLDGLKEKKFGPKSLVRDKPAQVAQTINVSRKRISTFTSDGLREKKNGPKGLLREKPVPVAPTINVSRERNSAFTSDGPREKNDPESLKIRIKNKQDSPKDVYQILKEFGSSPLEPMLSHLPESLLFLKESDCQRGKGLESEDKDTNMNQKKISPRSQESMIVTSNKSEDHTEKVSEGKPNETLELLASKDNSPSAGETQNKPTDRIKNSTVQDCSINDNWVYCDRCQKWRLLPLHADPTLLPEKWICSMVNWLPGMNKCSFSEDETTEAVRALYKINQNKDLKEEAPIKVKSLKRKCQLIIDDDDDSDEHSERRVFKILKPCSVEANNNVESKLQKRPAVSEQIPPEQMISDEKKRKMNFEEVNQSNLGNGKRAKITKKGKKRNTLPASSSPLPQIRTRNPGAKSSAAGKNISSGKKCKPAAASASERYGKLRRMILKRKTKREKDFFVIDDRNPKPVDQNNLRSQIGSSPPDFIKNCGNQITTSAFEEATKLKSHADRMKAEGLEREGTSMSFDAALKFLQVASLLEPKVTESGFFSGATENSISMYSDVAKLCGLCAEEYEKYGEMVAAAHAYKCTEVAYMRMIFIKHSTASASQRGHERYSCLIPTEDSPSSASELDNMTGLCDYKASYGHQNTLSLHNTEQDMNHAMEASRRAFSVYNHLLDSISSVKRVLDASFHDIDGLLHLSRISMEAVTHPSSLHR